MRWRGGSDRADPLLLDDRPELCAMAAPKLGITTITQNSTTADTRKRLAANNQALGFVPPMGFEPTLPP
jgi:hypothetical protein